MTVTRGCSSLLLISIWSGYLHNSCLKWPWGLNPLQDSWSKAALAFCHGSTVHSMPLSTNNIIKDWGSVPKTLNITENRTVLPSLLTSNFNGVHWEMTAQKKKEKGKHKKKAFKKHWLINRHAVALQLSFNP